MEPWVGLVILIATTSALPAGKDTQDAQVSPVYRLKSPAKVLVEYGPGYTASAVQPHLFLRSLDAVDPTNSLTCKYLQNDYLVFFIPQSEVNTFVESPVSKTVKLKEELKTKSGDMPWIIFLKKENTLELSNNYKKINLKSGNTDDPWELGAYTLAPPGSELAEYPDETLAAPPPFFPSLCVSPEKPKPFPVLFAPSTTQAALPSLASYAVSDLTPAVASGHPGTSPAVVVAPALAAAPPMATLGVPARVVAPAGTPVVVAAVSPVMKHAESHAYLRALNSFYPPGIIVVDPFYRPIVL